MASVVEDFLVFDDVGEQGAIGQGGLSVGVIGEHRQVVPVARRTFGADPELVAPTLDANQRRLPPEGACRGQHVYRRAREIEFGEMFRDVGPHLVRLVRFGDIPAAELDQDAVAQIVSRGSQDRRVA